MLSVNMAGKQTVYRSNKSQPNGYFYESACHKNNMCKQLMFLEKLYQKETGLWEINVSICNMFSRISHSSGETGRATGLYRSYRTLFRRSGKWYLHVCADIGWQLWGHAWTYGYRPQYSTLHSMAFSCSAVCVCVCVCERERESCACTCTSDGRCEDFCDACFLEVRLVPAGLPRSWLSKRARAALPAAWEEDERGARGAGEGRGKDVTSPIAVVSSFP